MSVTAMSRTFWTEFPELSYINKKGKQIVIKNSTAKIVLLAIADNADDFGENSYQSFETLATKSSIDRRSVMRVVRALVNHGVLEVAGVSAYGTNNYTVCLDKLGHPPKKRAKTGRPKSGDVESLAEKSGDVVTESGDSEEKSGDSGTESDDLKSPESSFIPPSSIPQTIDIDKAIFTSLSELTGGGLNSETPRLVDTWKEKHTLFWILKAVGIARSVKYIDAVLVGWEANGYPKSREERVKEKRNNGRPPREADKQAGGGSYEFCPECGAIPCQCDEVLP
jgi:hypothetical protein